MPPEGREWRYPPPSIYTYSYIGVYPEKMYTPSINSLCPYLYWRGLIVLGPPASSSKIRVGTRIM